MKDFWLSEQVRLTLLMAVCGGLWLLEAVMPLFHYARQRWQRAVPNVILTVILLLMNLLLSFASAVVAALAMQKQIGLFYWNALPLWAEALLGIAGLDLFAYFAHVLLHKSAFGWQFHRVHHSEIEVDVTTAFRQHPGETVWRIGWQLAAIVVFGIPLGVVIIYLMLSALNAQLEHANLHVPEKMDRLLRLVIVTPNMHKVHHSRAQIETDSNYANIFSIWDKLFGTYTPRKICLSSVMDWTVLMNRLNNLCPDC